VLDWNIGGHHETYLVAYVRNLRACGVNVVVLVTQPDRFRKAFAADSGVVVGGMPGMDWLKARRWLTRPLARHWFAQRTKRALAEGERALGMACDRSFISCIYESQATLTQTLIQTMNRPWAGLYLHAGVFHAGSGTPVGRRAKSVLRLFREGCPDCIFMLDAVMAKAVEDSTGRPVSLAPDFTDIRSGENQALPAELRALASGKPLVGLLGHLRPGKGVAELARIAVERPDLRLNYVFAGELNRDTFSPEELVWLDRASALRDRVCLYPHRLPDGPCYNSLVEKCSVLWAVYPKSPHSSNTLTKAAAFERPVIVADGYLMARHTREYRMGEVIRADDVEAGAAALARLTNDPEGWRQAAKPRWTEYAALHSEERLQALLREWLYASPRR
jgi:hypothetical protein